MPLAPLIHLETDRNEPGTFPEENGVVNRKSSIIGDQDSAWSSYYWMHHWSSSNQESVVKKADK